MIFLKKLTFIILLINLALKTEAQMTSTFPNIDFDTLTTYTGKIVYYADFISMELEKMLQNVPVKRLEYLDKNDYRSYQIKENDYLIHLHEYKGGMVYKSINDFLLYEEHFEVIKKPAQKNYYKSFVTEEGLIIDYEIKDTSQQIIDQMNYDFERKYPFAEIGNLVYVLPSNYAEYFWVFNSVKDFDLFLEYPVKSLLLGCNPYRKDILEYKDEIINKQVIEYFSISSSKLDFTHRSLLIIDKIINNKLGASDRLYYETILGQVLYLGRVLILSNPDRYMWIIVEEINNTYEPILLDKYNNRKIPLHTYIYDSLVEKHPTYSTLYFIYDMIVNSTFIPK